MAGKDARAVETIGYSECAIHLVHGVVYKELKYGEGYKKYTQGSVLPEKLVHRQYLRQISKVEKQSEDLSPLDWVDLLV